MVSGLAERGWELFPAEAEVEAWARAALPVARERMADPEERGKWLRCAGTWFVGVDALPNDAAGRVGGSEPLGGRAIAAVRALYGDLPLHRGQVSAVHPGYPKPREGEGEAAFRYRRSATPPMSTGCTRWARIGAGASRSGTPTYSGFR